MRVRDASLPKVRCGSYKTSGAAVNAAPLTSFDTQGAADIANRWAYSKDIPWNHRSSPASHATVTVMQVSNSAPASRTNAGDTVHTVRKHSFTV